MKTEGEWRRERLAGESAGRQSSRALALSSRSCFSRREGRCARNQRASSTQTPTLSPQKDDWQVISTTARKRDLQVRFFPLAVPRRRVPTCAKKRVISGFPEASFAEDYFCRGSRDPLTLFPWQQLEPRSRAAADTSSRLASSLADFMA